jgi:apolipoprotein N-acyltransferase
VERIKLLLWSILSGGIFAVAWPSVGGISFAIFSAFIPLLWVEHRLSEKSRSALVVFFHAYLAFFVFNISTTWWIKNADLMGSVMAIFCNSFFMAVVFWVFHLTKKYVGKKEGYIGLIIYWLAFEYLHINWELSWIWLTFGNVFASSIESIQWYEYTGVLGGSFWILAVNVLLFIAIGSLKDKVKQNYKLFGFALILIIVPSIIGTYMYETHEEKGKGYNFVVVQPNIDPYFEKFGGLAPSDQIDKMIGLAKQEISAETDYLIFPETAIPEADWEHTIEYSYPAEEIRKLNVNYPKLNTVIGMMSSVFFPDNTNLSNTAKALPGGGYYDNYNTAIRINVGNKDSIDIHHKSKLVLGAEKIPFMKYIPWMQKLSIRLGGTTGRYGIQDEPTIFKNEDDFGLGPIICYESIYGEYVTQYSKLGASIFTIITNDGWWGDTPGYKQHLSFASLRAIENRRSIARSANTGTSAFINQRGDITSNTKWWEEAVIKGELQANDEITFYVKHGDYIGRIAGFLAPLLILLTIVKKLNKTGQKLSSAKA